MAIQFDDDWALAQTNRPLMSEEEAGYAYVASLEAEVRFHPERWKNWDNYLAVYHAVAGSFGFAVGQKHDVFLGDKRVLDAGACRDPLSPSAFLPSLHHIGFNHLYGCNLDEPGNTREGGIAYSRQDITRTSYEDEFFNYAACLSTLEHGVDEFDFLDEMWRVLKPAGRLFISFDYWHDKIDTGGRMAFGAPVRIFNHCDVDDMLCYANNIGFEVPSYEWRCQDPVVKWIGLEYTFLNLLLEKPTR